MGVIVAGLFAAGVGKSLAVGTEVILLGTAPGTHRCLIGFAAEDVNSLLHHGLAVFDRNDINARNLIHPVVPMTIHEVFIDTSGGFVQTFVQFVEILGTLNRNSGDVGYGFAVGRYYCFGL